MISRQCPAAAQHVQTRFRGRCVIEHGGYGPPGWFLWEGSCSSSPLLPHGGRQRPGAPPDWGLNAPTVSVSVPQPEHRRRQVRCHWDFPPTDGNPATSGLVPQPPSAFVEKQPDPDRHPVQPDQRRHCSLQAAGRQTLWRGTESALPWRPIPRLSVSVPSLNIGGVRCAVTGTLHPPGTALRTISATCRGRQQPSLR